MKKTVFHGTSADNLQSILENGLSTNEIKVWNTSLDEVYVWEPEALAESMGWEDEDYEYKKERAFQNAFESAQTSLSMAKDCRAIVIEIEIDESELQIDQSHENMGYARCVWRNINPSEFISIKLSNDLSLIKGYFIANAMQNDLCNIEFDRLETKIGQAFIDSSIEFIDEMDSIAEWEEVQLPELMIYS